MNVAFEVEHDFFGLRLELIHQTRPRLGNIEAVVLSGKGIDVVKKLSLFLIWTVWPTRTPTTRGKYTQFVSGR